MLSVIKTKASAESIMAKDALLLSELDSTPLLHLYEWEAESATFGYFVDPFLFLNKEGIKKRGLNIARRPTGGGVVFHLCDLAFSLLIPSTHAWYSSNTLQNYAHVNQKVIQAIQCFVGADCMPQLLPQEPLSLDNASAYFCMAKPTKFDVMVNGKKVGGAAQRRTKKGFLHQGTIALALLPKEYLMDVLNPGTKVAEAIELNSFSLLSKEWTPSQLKKSRSDLTFLLQKVFSDI